MTDLWLDTAVNNGHDLRSSYKRTELSWHLETWSVFGNFFSILTVFDKFNILIDKLGCISAMQNFIWGNCLFPLLCWFCSDAFYSSQQKAGFG